MAGGTAAGPSGADAPTVALTKGTGRSGAFSKQGPGNKDTKDNEGAQASDSSPRKGSASMASAVPHTATGTSAAVTSDSESAARRVRSLQELEGLGSSGGLPSGMDY